MWEGEGVKKGEDIVVAVSGVGVGRRER